MSCAAAVAVTDAFEEEKILDNVNARCGRDSLGQIARAEPHSYPDTDPQSFSKDCRH